MEENIYTKNYKKEYPVEKCPSCKKEMDVLKIDSIAYYICDCQINFKA